MIVSSGDADDSDIVGSSGMDPILDCSSYFTLPSMGMGRSIGQYAYQCKMTKMKYTVTSKPQTENL